jgi:cytochrome c oxidase assembly factor CtaG
MSQWPSLGEWHFSSFCWASIIMLIVAVVFRRHLASFWAAVVTACTMFWWLGSSISSMAMNSYPDHMINHLVLLLIVAPIFARALSLRVVGWQIASSLVALAFLIPAYHVTQLGAFAMRQPGADVIENILFLLVGTVFFSPIVSKRSSSSDLLRVVLCLLSAPMLFGTGLVLCAAGMASLPVLDMGMPMISVATIHSGGYVMLAGGGVLILYACIITVMAWWRKSRRTSQPGALTTR